MYGFTISGKHSYNDFGLRIVSREMNPPAKKKIKENVPFMNGSYDFSMIDENQAYEERSIRYVLHMKYRNKYEYASKKVQISDWLMNSLKSMLTDDLIPQFYFLAECEGDLNFDEYSVGCDIEVNFKAYPFMMYEKFEGDDIWDTFNFELDYAQEVLYNVNGTMDIVLYNPSAIKITPEVICSTSMQVIRDSITYDFISGTNKNWRFSLNTGRNELTLKGTGTIEFKFRREVL